MSDMLHCILLSVYSFLVYYHQRERESGQPAGCITVSWKVPSPGDKSITSLRYTSYIYIYIYIVCVCVCVLQETSQLADKPVMLLFYGRPKKRPSDL